MGPSIKKPAYVLSSDEFHLHLSRRYKPFFLDYLWRKEETDPFDLRYLYDVEEIQDNKERLLQELEYSLNVNPNYYEYLYDENNQELQDDDWILNFVPIQNQNRYNFFPEENWDYEEFGIRYNFYYNIYNPEYDSGVDEPNLRHLPYQDDEEEHHLIENDEKFLEQRRVRILEIIQESSRKRFKERT